MPHPLVDQLRFTRSEFSRGLSAVSDPEAQHQLGRLNCISWIVGHLAWQEQRYWLTRAQEKTLLPELNDKYANEQPASVPSSAEVWAAWKLVTGASDPWLDSLTTADLEKPLVEGYPSIGTFLQRMIYHYWYHLGEGMAVRQMLDHTALPDFVGNLDAFAPYRAETDPQPERRMTREELIRQVTEARAELDGLVRGVPQDSMLEPGVDGDWSLKDVLAHITWHEKEMVGVLRQRALVGSDLWQLPLEQRNQAIYQQLRDLPPQQVVEEFQTVFRSLLLEIEKLSDEDLIDPARFADMPAHWLPWDVLASNTFQHYSDHLLSIQSWLKSASSNRSSVNRIAKGD